MSAHPVTGLDVSAYQHPPYQRAPIDWSAVAAAGHSFAIIKATEGAHYTNPHFWSDRHQARAHGLITGSYHFLRWERGAASPEAQARHYAKTVGDARGQILACDLEWIKGAKRPADEIVKVVVDFQGEVEAQTKRWPMIYTGPTFWRYCLAPARGAAELDLTSWPLWLVDYEPPLDPMVGAPDWRWLIHQHTGSGSCPGVQGHCDLNVARDMRTLREMAGLDPDGTAVTA